MKELIIKFQPFVFKQVVFIKEGRKVSQQEVPQRELAEFISLCNNVDCVHFFGNEKFARKIKDDCICKYKMMPNRTKFVFNK